MTDREVVIKIPEEQYKYILWSDNSAFADLVSKEMMMHIIKNGIPLPEEPVLDKIRAEIETKIGERGLDDYDFCSGLICARKIIDKHLAEMEKSRSKGKRKESEE